MIRPPRFQALRFAPPLAAALLTCGLGGGVTFGFASPTPEGVLRKAGHECPCGMHCGGTCCCAVKSAAVEARHATGPGGHDEAAPISKSSIPGGRVPCLASAPCRGPDAPAPAESPGGDRMAAAASTGVASPEHPGETLRPIASEAAPIAAPSPPDRPPRPGTFAG